MPEAATKTSAESGRFQRRFLRWTRWLLLLNLAAAALGVVALTDAGQRRAAVIGIVLFALGAILAGRLAIERPNRRWYDLRAAAESAKTLAIQYAVAGGAFAAGEPTVDGDYRSAVHSIPVALRHLPALGPLDDPITTGLAEIRGRSFGERKELYLRDRVQDQWDWYERKAKTNDDAADRWRALMFAGQAGGLVAGALKALGYWNLSALGIAAAFTAAAAAWTRTKDYEGLAEAYKVTARELPAVHAAGVAVATEKDWAPYVSDAEAAFSREHTLWLARRG